MKYRILKQTYLGRSNHYAQYCDVPWPFSMIEGNWGYLKSSPASTGESTLENAKLDIDYDIDQRKRLKDDANRIKIEHLSHP